MTKANNQLQNRVNAIADMISNEDWHNGCSAEDLGVDQEEYDATNTAFNWLTDALDLEYVVHSNKSFKGARILVTYGGPNIWVDTVTNTVEGLWWGDKATATFDGPGAEEIEQACQDLFDAA